MEIESLDSIAKTAMSIGKDGCFCINGRFKCSFKDGKHSQEAFSQWEKDSNSPSLFSKAEVDVVDENGEHLDGFLQLQYDSKLSNKSYAQLLTKHIGSNDCESMCNVTNIAIM